MVMYFSRVLLLPTIPEGRQTQTHESYSPRNGAEEAQHFNFKTTKTLTEFIIQRLYNMDHPEHTLKLFYKGLHYLLKI